MVCTGVSYDRWLRRGDRFNAAAVHVGLVFLWNVLYFQKYSWALVVLEPSITGEGLLRETGYRLDAATIRVNV